MILEVFAVENNAPLDEHEFNALMKAAPTEKKQKILNQKLKSNADNSLIGIALAKYAVSKVFGIHGAELEIAYAPNGKPYLKNSPEIHLSISHSHNMIVCVVSDCEVGIDVEKIRAFSKSVCDKVFGSEITRTASSSDAPSEAFTALWTQKEAILKLTGEGISGIRKKINTNKYFTETVFYKCYCITVAAQKRCE